LFDPSGDDWSQCQGGGNRSIWNSMVYAPDMDSAMWHPKVSTSQGSSGAAHSEVSAYLSNRDRQQHGGATWGDYAAEASGRNRIRAHAHAAAAAGAYDVNANWSNEGQADAPERSPIRADAPLFTPNWTKAISDWQADFATSSTRKSAKISASRFTDAAVHAQDTGSAQRSSKQIAEDRQRKVGKNKMYSNQPASLSAHPGQQSVAEQAQDLRAFPRAEALSATCSTLQQVTNQSMQDAEALKVGLGQLAEIVDLGPEQLRNTVLQVLELGWDKITWNRQYTALHLAVELNRPDVVRLLVALGADMTVRDWKKRTAMDVAISRKREACVEVLHVLEMRQSNVD